MTQKALFEKWKQLEGTIEAIGSVLQNDYERMISEGVLTRQDVADLIPVYEETCQVFEKRYDQLKELTRHYLVIQSKE